MSRKTYSDTRKDFLRALMAFLKTDIDTGLTFATIAATTGNEETRARNIRGARHAYNTVLHYLSRIEPKKRKGINRYLKKLKSELEKLGEAF